MEIHNHSWLQLIYSIDSHIEILRPCIPCHIPLHEFRIIRIYCNRISNRLATKVPLLVLFRIIRINLLIIGLPGFLIHPFVPRMYAFNPSNIGFQCSTTQSHREGRPYQNIVHQPFQNLQHSQFVRCTNHSLLSNYSLKYTHLANSSPLNENTPPAPKFDHSNANPHQTNPSPASMRRIFSFTRSSFRSSRSCATSSPSMSNPSTYSSPRGRPSLRYRSTRPLLGIGPW